MNSLRHFVAVSFGSVVICAGLAGCTHERPQNISGAAVMAVEGNRTISYTAPTDGMVTVYDTNDDKTIYSGRVSKGQNVMVDADKHEIAVDGRPVNENIPGGHVNRVYFEARDHADRTSTIETNTVETTHADR